MASSVEKSESVAGAPLSHRQILYVVFGLMMGMFLASLDQTIVSTAIKTIADDLNGYSMQAWVTTAYLITSTIVTPLYGKLSDIYGRKPFFMFAIVVFVFGSLICSFAQNMYELAAFRAIQGLGAGGLMSLALTIIADIVSPRDRPKYQGYFLAVFGTSSVLGPVLGGFFAGQDSIFGVSGWRWVFLVNVPLGVVALFVVYRVLNYNQIKATKQPIDYWGAATLTLGLVPLLIVAEQGRVWGWSSQWAVICYCVGALGVAAFIYVEYKMGEAAIIPLRIFKNSVFAQGILLAIVVGAVMFGAISMLPQYYQIIQGSSPTLAGMQMLPMVFGLMVASISAGIFISRTGHYKKIAIFGSIALVVAPFVLHYITIDTPIYQVMITTFVLGLGLGCMMQPLMIAMQSILEPKDLGVATASSTFFRQIGGTLGVAVFLSVLFSVLGGNISHEMQTAAKEPGFAQSVVASTRSDDKDVREFGTSIIESNKSGENSSAGGVLDDTSVIEKLPTELGDPIKRGFSESMDRVFLCVSVLAVLGFLLTVTWREMPLRSTKPGEVEIAESL